MSIRLRGKLGLPRIRSFLTQSRPAVVVWLPRTSLSSLMCLRDDVPMWKQAAGFALFGAVVALLGAALSQGVTGSHGYSSFVVGARFNGDGLSSSGLASITFVGTVVGALSGAVLRLAGVRTVTDPGYRVGRVVGAGLFGIALGLLPAIIWVGSAFYGLAENEFVAFPVDTILVVYAISVALAYAFALLAVRTVLRACADPAATRTVRAVALSLGVGGVAATVAGMATGRLLGYTTTASTWVAVVLVVMLVLAAALASARGLVIRGVRAREGRQ